MTPRDMTTAPSSRRRPSLSFRRPRTATVSAIPTPPRVGLEHDTWDGLSLVDSGDCMDEHVLEDVSHFPEPAQRRRAAKSFSSLRHPVDGLRALSRRLSVTMRTKSSRAFNIPHQNDHKLGTYNANSSHEFASSASTLQGFPISLPIPGNGLEPPVLPDGMYSGAAARAAAAAQNEMVRKMEYIKLNNQDSESGIGIDLQDRSEFSDLEPGHVRLDPMTSFPSEIIAQVLSYLDPESLMNSELVSRDWREQASSKHVWRHVFRRCYAQRRLADSRPQKHLAVGLGKSTFQQDWKKLYLVRRALDRRWKDGKAAAIYLQGHTDSVYCVQFDEDKIITGSRDRTIRVWDAHYPWPCRKIIGPPPGDVNNTGPVHDPEQQSSGRSPFLTIRPPPTRSAEIVDLSARSHDYHSASILCLQFDDEIMVTGSSDYSCIVWDIKNDYRPIHRLEGHTAGVLDVCFDERYIVSCSKDHAICVWDRRTGVLVKKLLGHRGPVNAVQLRGDLIVSASGDGVAKLWNVTSGLCVKEFTSKDRGLACVEFSHDGRTVLTGGNDQMIYQFDANTGELVKEIEGHSGLVRSLHLDTDNQRIVSGSYDMSVKVFDSQSGELSTDFPGWTTSWMLSVKSDYRRIVATSQDSRAVIMDFGYGIDGIDLLEG
ncbi:WD40-repeat-containing domain protein [Aspergillus pseudoustus]|uniref:Probable E3 ubiquitin ligase complex SCF subunit sconB n=1 Tax=Aspergillus pseudoustus TaxID=1810923 RepID=A0ABR4KRD4_9EURO